MQKAGRFACVFTSPLVADPPDRMHVHHFCINMDQAQHVHDAQQLSRAGWLAGSMNAAQSDHHSLPHCMQNFRLLPLWARSWQPS